MIPESEWEWFGSAAHLIVGNDCRFHLATVIGDHLVSTVGEYLPNSAAREFQEIGFGRKYETMVFRVTDDRCTADDCACGLPVVADWSGLDMDGYNVRGDAQRGHYAMCRKYAARERSAA